VNQQTVITPVGQRTFASGLHSVLLRCGRTSAATCPCHGDWGAVSRSAFGPSPTPAPAIVHEILSLSGEPLPVASRQVLEPRFGRDFSDVRIHAGTRAAQAAEAVSARAFTVGHHVVFGSQQYEPQTKSGLTLLSHELTHVTQQDGSTTGPHHELRLDDQHGPLEAEAVQSASLTSMALTPRAESTPAQGRAAIARSGAGVVMRDGPKAPPPPPSAPSPICGPDATDWFIAQVAAAKADAVVLRVQADLQGAERVAASYGFSARNIAEGAVSKKVFAEEQRAGFPKRSPEASGQIAASKPGQAAFGRAFMAATVPFVGAPEALVMAAIKRAGLTWASLVGTGRKYDFKNDKRTMRGPTSPHCPVGCANTITLCPASGSDCFATDVPGNLFYAHVGRFVGWTELALQLGSEFAQLQSTRTWDPPEDTRMIKFGYRLPDPLTRADLCAAVNAFRASFIQPPCLNCPELTSAVPV
jgi:hypothetical protein